MNPFLNPCRKQIYPFDGVKYFCKEVMKDEYLIGKLILVNILLETSIVKIDHNLSTKHSWNVGH